MRSLISALAILVSSVAQPPTTLPPAYPRVGATKILDNARVQVWNIAWLKGQPSPLHRHLYDLVGVYYEPGDRMIISPEGAKRPVSTKAWDIAFQRSGVTHVEEGVSDAPLRSVFVELKLEGPYGTDTGGDVPLFSDAGGTRRLDNERVTVWEFTQVPSLKSHRHAHDAVAVSFGAVTPTATWIPQGTTHAAEGTGTTSRVYVFEIK
jgi:hypothetical protein